MEKIYKVKYCDENDALVDIVFETASLPEALKVLAEHSKIANWYSGYVDFIANGETVYRSIPDPHTDLPPCPFGFGTVEKIPTPMMVDLLAAQTDYINSHSDCDELVISSRLDCMRQLVQLAIDKGFDLGSIPGLADAAIDAGVKRRNQWNDEEGYEHITRDEFINDDDFLVPAYEIGFFEATNLIDFKLVEATARAAIEYLNK